MSYYKKLGISGQPTERFAWLASTYLVFGRRSTDTAAGKEAIRVKSAVGGLAGRRHCHGRLQAGMGIKDRADILGEQFKVFPRHTVAPSCLQYTYIVRNGEFLVNQASWQRQR